MSFSGYDVSELEAPETIEMTTGRQPLGDVSNFRRTRSVTARQRTEETDLTKTKYRRRSARLTSKEQQTKTIYSLHKSSVNDKCRIKTAKQSSQLARGRRKTARICKASKYSTIIPESSLSATFTKDRQQIPDEKYPIQQNGINSKRPRNLSSEQHRNIEAESISNDIDPNHRYHKRGRLNEAACSTISSSEDSRCQETKENHSNVNDESEEVQSQTQSFTDIMEEAHHNLVLAPFDDSKYTAGISVYDTPSKGKVLEAPEYVTDIFQRLYNAETQHLLNPYLHMQPRINGVMRSILVDWLVEVHMKFRLEQETLYLCVNILDRYLSSVIVERKQLQLVGVTALLLASKYEEIYPPEVKDCVYITDRAYTRQEILDMEANILRVLKFNLTVPNSFLFLQRFLFITNATPCMRYAASYYLDRMLQEHDVLQFRPSLVAAAVVCLAINHPEIREYDGLEETKPGLPKVLLDYTEYAPASILEAATFITSQIVVEVQTVSKRELVAVKRKYEGARFKFVSSDFEPPSVDDIIG